MEYEAAFNQYIDGRDQFLRRIGEVTAEIEAWVDKYSQEEPTLTDIAHFEGLRASRFRLLSDFEQAEDRFVLRLLALLNAPEQPSPQL
jgi:hypothetical protein